MELHGVVAGVPAPPHGLRELLDEVFDLARRERMGRLALGGVLDGGGGDGTAAGNRAVRLTACVIGLDGDLRPVGVDAADELAVLGHEVVRPDAGKVLEARAERVDRVVLADDEPPAALGLLLVVADVALGEPSARGGVFGEHGWDDEAVLGFERADAARLEESLELHGALLGSCLPHSVHGADSCCQ